MKPVPSERQILYFLFQLRLTCAKLITQLLLPGGAAVCELGRERYLVPLRHCFQRSAFIRFPSLECLFKRIHALFTPLLEIARQFGLDPGPDGLALVFCR